MLFYVVHERKLKELEAQNPYQPKVKVTTKRISKSNGQSEISITNQGQWWGNSRTPSKTKFSNPSYYQTDRFWNWVGLVTFL